jgi:hypothetical protein
VPQCAQCTAVQNCFINRAQDTLSLQAFEKTGLGARVANLFIAAAGQSSLGMAYGLAVAEALVAPAMPSCTARAGGIFMPVCACLFILRGQGGQLRMLVGRLGRITCCASHLKHNPLSYMTAPAQVIKQVAVAQGSEPKSNRKRLGAFLVHSQMQVRCPLPLAYVAGVAFPIALGGRTGCRHKHATLTASAACQFKLSLSFARCPPTWLRCS